MGPDGTAAFPGQSRLRYSPSQRKGLWMALRPALLFYLIRCQVITPTQRPAWNLPPLHRSPWWQCLVLHTGTLVRSLRVIYSESACSSRRGTVEREERASGAEDTGSIPPSTPPESRQAFPPLPARLPPSHRGLDKDGTRLRETHRSLSLLQSRDLQQ